MTSTFRAHHVRTISNRSLPACAQEYLVSLVVRYELPVVSADFSSPSLLQRFRKLRPLQLSKPPSELSSADSGDREDPTSSFTGLNGLEIAAVADCKKFLSQRIVQKI